jgi:hypothetical protein
MRAGFLRHRSFIRPGVPGFTVEIVKKQSSCHKARGLQPTHRVSFFLR